MGLLQLLGTCSQHPLAVAIVQEAEDRGADYRSADVNNFTSITGKGIKGIVENNMYFIGNPQLFTEYDVAINHKEQINDLQEQGKTVMVIGTKAEVLALIAVADEIRESSKAAIRKLHAMGIEKTIMLTGDNQGTANAIGAVAGVHDIQADLLPEDKLTLIKKLKEQYGLVAMVGDGVNDAPASATSTVGIAMGGAGTDTALETADIALMGDDLSKLPYTIKLSRKTLQIIKQNITFALAIKVVALLLIAPGWLTLWMAIFADMGAHLL